MEETKMDENDNVDNSQEITKPSDIENNNKENSVQKEEEPNRPPAVPSIIKPSKIEREFRKEIQSYYRDHFDIDFLVKLLKEHPFETREFGFIRRDDNRMYRNKSFEKPELLVEYLSTFVVNHSYIGAIYEDRVMPNINYTPGTSIDQTEWLGRELTFDLDLTDYDTVRTCGCQGRDFCSSCWKLMQEAAEIIEDTLKHEFGFKEIVWIFSGGRGYHCWILDDIAFELTEQQRKAIVGYFQLIYTTVNYEKVEEISKLSVPLRDRVYQKLVRPYFLKTPIEELEKIDGIGKKTVEIAKEKFQHSAIPSKIMQTIPKQAREEVLKTVIRTHYPRLDAAVTEGHNHLIRLPGSIHMGSGYITQVISDPVNFDPLKDGKHFYDFLEKDRSDIHFDSAYQSTIFKVDDPNYARWRIVETFKNLVHRHLFFEIDQKPTVSYSEVVSAILDKLQLEISKLISRYNSLIELPEGEKDQKELENLTEKILSEVLYLVERATYQIEVSHFVGLARDEDFDRTVSLALINQIQEILELNLKDKILEMSEHLVDQDLSKVTGIGPKLAQELAENGITTFKQLLQMSIEELTSYDGVGESTAEKILSVARELIIEGELDE